MNIKIKKLEDLSELEKLSLSDFSYSRIDTYNLCPTKYFYSYVIREPRQFNAPAVLGNIVHDVLENVLDNDKELNLKELQDEYSNAIDVWDPSRRIDSSLINIGRHILNEFYDTNHDTKLNILDKELEFNFIIGSYYIRGFIDRVDKIGNKIHITDYKTGKNEVSLKDVRNNLQLGIYALALKEAFPDCEIYAELYYLRSGRRKGHLFTNEDLSLHKSRLINNINQIINDDNFLPTSNVRICSFCDHAKSGTCNIGVYRNKNSGVNRNG